MLPDLTVIEVTDKKTDWITVVRFVSRRLAVREVAGYEPKISNYENVHEHGHELKGTLYTLPPTITCLVVYVRVHIARISTMIRGEKAEGHLGSDYQNRV
jgi:hypothetical protein